MKDAKGLIFVSSQSARPPTEWAESQIVTVYSPQYGKIGEQYTFGDVKRTFLTCQGDEEAWNKECSSERVVYIVPMPSLQVLCRLHSNFHCCKVIIHGKEVRQFIGVRLTEKDVAFLK